MLMPAEQAFWCLVAIMNKYLPGYYSDGLLAVQLDGRVMESLVNDIDPKISAFLVRITGWFSLSVHIHYNEI